MRSGHQILTPFLVLVSTPKKISSVRTHGGGLFGLVDKNL